MEIPKSKLAVILFFLVMVLVGATIGILNGLQPAHEKCVDACLVSASCAPNELQGTTYTTCEKARDRCVDQCNRNSDGHDSYQIERYQYPPPITGIYGAIAYNKVNGNWGVSDRSPDASYAAKSALTYCGSSDCEIVETFSKTCMAIAAGTGNRVAWALGDDPKQARLDAIGKCEERAYGNDHSPCVMQISNCYFP